MREYYVVPSGVIYLALLGANATDWSETVFGRTDRPILWASGNPSDATELTRTVRLR